jgi:excisionase family DNA binding protein
MAKTKGKKPEKEKAIYAEETLVITGEDTEDINEEETKDINAETLMRLDVLNQQLTELLQMQRKITLGCEYINVNELAELLGEKVSTIYARVHSRQIPYYKPGGKNLFFKLDEIHEWIHTTRHSTMDELRERI